MKTLFIPVHDKFIGSGEQKTHYHMTTNTLGNAHYQQVSLLFTINSKFTNRLIQGGTHSLTCAHTHTHTHTHTRTHTHTHTHAHAHTHTSHRIPWAHDLLRVQSALRCTARRRNDRWTDPRQGKCGTHLALSGSGQILLPDWPQPGVRGEEGGEEEGGRREFGDVILGFLTPGDYFLILRTV